MSASNPFESFQADRREPLSLCLRERSAPAEYEGLRCLALEYSSRGDRVQGQLVLPSGAGPHPVILLVHGLGSSRNGDAMAAIGARWVARGAAVAAIDLPLHGERSSAKMSERLQASAQAALVRGFEDSVDEMLWSEFARQSVIDLQRLVDALGHVDAADPGRLVYVGFSLGGMLGSVFCAVDERPRGAALALAGACPARGALDTQRAVAAIAPRPLLFVNASGDELIPREHTERLFDAAGEPRRIEWFDAGHRDLPGAAMKSIWQFAHPLLGLP